MTVADRCPGVLRPHQAADGSVIRVRIPGGRTTGRVLGALTDLAERYGNGELQLTSRAGLQLRGLPDPLPQGLVGGLVELGLLPSVDHDRVRNIVASPFTGLRADTADLRGLIAELDAGLISDPVLAGLPGRFLFALDDGSGDVAGLPFDLGYLAADRTRGELLLGSARHRIQVEAEAATAGLLRLARDFLAARPSAGKHWHVRDLAGWAATRAAVLTDDVPDAVAPPLGRVAGAASVQVPLGLLTPAQAHLVARLAGTEAVVVTPDRGLVLPGRADALPKLLGAGLIADEDSGWALVSACVGAPHCARTGLDTRAAATDLVRAGVAVRTHVSGCDRRCGAPTVPHRELVGA